MTRFQIAVIKDKTIYTSTEFNGDGYWEGYGHDVYAALQNINSVEEWQDFVTEFNSETFQYKEKLHYEYSGLLYEAMLDMSKGYFDNWFSDYVYIKNLDDEYVSVTTEEGTVCVDFDEVAVFNFGHKLIPGTDKLELDDQNDDDSQEERDVTSADMSDIAYAIENGFTSGCLDNGIEWRLEFDY